MSLGVEMFYCVLPKDMFARDRRTLTKSGHQHEPVPLPNQVVLMVFGFGSRIQSRVVYHIKLSPFLSAIPTGTVSQLFIVGGDIS